MRRITSLKFSKFFLNLKKNCPTVQVFLPQLLRPIATENSMCRPLKEVKSYVTILKKIRATLLNS